MVTEPNQIKFHDCCENVLYYSQLFCPNMNILHLYNLYYEFGQYELHYNKFVYKFSQTAIPYSRTLKKKSFRQFPFKYIYYSLK